MFAQKKPRRRSASLPPRSPIAPAVVPRRRSSSNPQGLNWGLKNTPVSPPEHAKEKPPEWRRWNANTKTAETLHHVPRSTAKIPDTLYHVTHYTNLDSIQEKGLDPSFVNTKKGLNAEADVKDYAVRDSALKATYLGISKDPGMSMSSEESLQKGGKVVLAVKVPPAFKFSHLRSSNATGSAPTVDEKERGNTVLSFAKIPPEFISVQHTTSGKMHNLSEFPEKPDWRPYASQPASGEELPSREALEEQEKRKKELLKQANEYTPPSEVPESRNIEPEKKKGLTPQMQEHIARFQEKQSQSDQEEDDDEWNDT